eukprot:8613634-Alexandrium_andersonii.AAC.1
MLAYAHMHVYTQQRLLYAVWGRSWMLGAFSHRLTSPGAADTCSTHLTHMHGGAVCSAGQAQ